MASGQHVGRQSDALVEDDDLTAARRNQKVLAAAVKPRALPRSFHDIGDGDRCPLNPSHGKMLVIRGTDRQHCPEQSHDGYHDSRVHPGGVPQERAFWPLHNFEEAVRLFNTLQSPDASKTLLTEVAE